MGKTCRTCEYFLPSHFDKNVGACTLENNICLVENAESDWCDFYEEEEGEVEHEEKDSATMQ